MSGDVDQPDPMLLRQAGFENLEARCEWAAGLLLITGDQQHTGDAGLADGAREKFIERLAVRKRPRGDVRDRVKAGAGDRRGNRDLPGGIISRQPREEGLGAWLATLDQFRDMIPAR